MSDLFPMCKCGANASTPHSVLKNGGVHGIDTGTAKYTSELPNVEQGMRLDQALFLELYHILVESGVITKEQAVKRYRSRWA